MDNDLEQRLERLVGFLKKHTRGLFDDRKPHRKGIYFEEFSVPEVCANNREIVEMVADGEAAIEGGVQINEGLPWEEFDNEYIQVRLGVTSQRFWNALVASKPDVVLDVPFGDGTLAEKKITDLRSQCDKDIRLIGLDKCASTLFEAKNRDISDSELFLGSVDVQGNVQMSFSPYPCMQFPQYDPNVFKGDRKAVLSFNACNETSDNIAEFVIKNDVDYFFIKRCCYSGLSGRKYKTDIPQDLPINDKVADILTQEYRSKLFDTKPRLVKDFLYCLFSGCKTPNRLLRVANLMTADLTRYLVTLDLAVHMQRNGYKVGIDRPKQGYIVYGVKA